MLMLKKLYVCPLLKGLNASPLPGPKNDFNVSSNEEEEACRNVVWELLLLNPLIWHTIEGFLRTHSLIFIFFIFQINFLWSLS